MSIFAKLRAWVTRRSALNRNRTRRDGSRSSIASKQSGAGVVEVIVVAGVAIPLALAGVQVALMYNAKNILNNATFEAARVGAVEHANEGPMKEALARNLMPLYGGGTSADKLALSYGKAKLDLSQPATGSDVGGAGLTLQVLSPTKQAFEDFGYDDPQGHRAIPVSHLKYRDRSVGDASGVNIQDANLLKIKVKYGYRLFVPMVNKMIGKAMAIADPANKLYYLSDPPRLPIEATATVRMQSEAYLANNASFDPDGGGGAVPGSSGGGAVPPPESEEGAGGDPAPPPPEEEPELPSGNPNAATDPKATFFESLPTELVAEENGEGLACQLLRTCGTGTPGEFCYVTPPVAQSLVQKAGGFSNSSSISNPINALNGNKFQEEVDLPPLAGPLGIQFVRYYNSQASHKHDALGAGWSHSYDVSFGRINKRLVWIKQADGRAIVFRKQTVEGEYAARLANDGTLTVSASGAVWRWQSGRQVHFNADGHLAKVIDESGAALHLAYNDQGRLLQVTDPDRRTLGFRYYTNNRIKEVFDNTGKTIRFRYDFAGNLESVERLGGDKRTYHYEDARHPQALTGITDGRGVRYATWAYDERGRAVLGTHAEGSEQAFIEYGDSAAIVTDALGRRSTYRSTTQHGIPLLTRIDGPGCSSCGSSDVEFGYDDRLRLTTVTTKDGDVVRYEYDDQNRVSVQTYFAPDGKPTGWVRTNYAGKSRQPQRVATPSIHRQGEHVAEYTYNADGHLVGLTETGYAPDKKRGFRPIKRTVTFSYEHDKVTKIDGPRGDVDDVVHFDYDADGRLVASRYPDGTVQKVLAYDAYDRPVRTQMNDEVPTDYAYDERGNLISAARGPRTVKYDYDPDGRVIGLTNPNGVTLRVDYDDAGRQTAMVDGQGNRYGRRWDSADRLVGSFIETAAGENLLALLRLYDAEDRLRAVVSPDGAQYMAGFDEKTGRKNLELDGGKRGDFYFAADKTKHYLGVLAGDGGITETLGSERQGVKAIRDAAGRVTVQVRDDFGNLMLEGTPDTGVTEYRYDEAGNVTTIIDTTGAERSYRYDAAGQLLEARDPDGQSTFRYRDGRLWSACRAANCDEYDYDHYGELALHRQTIDGHVFETRYAYDTKTGELVQRVLPSGETLTYEYQANLGRLSHIRRQGWFTDDEILSDVTYQPFGQRTGYTLRDGVRVNFDYDRTGRVRAMRTGNVGSLRYHYDGSGNIVGIERDTTHERYGYDAVSRLIEASAGTTNQTFDYDTLGRRTDPSGLIKVSANAKTNDAATVRDARGLTTTLDERRFDYTSQGQPLKLYIKGELRAEYTYNSAGVRIKKVVHTEHGARTTYYLYDVQARLTAEADDHGSITREYVYLGQTPVALLQDGKIYSVQTDHLGTPTALRDQKGRTVWKASYAAFGQATISGSQANFNFNLRFPGQYADDESGLHYNYFRYYDPKAGQYLQPDPMGIKTGLNRYAYVDNNPLRYSDPLGLFKVRDGALNTGIKKFDKDGNLIWDGRISFFGEPIHEGIVRDAFALFNRDKSHPDVFSAHTIELFIQANVRTDLIFDSSHQFSSVNHLDRPSDGWLDGNHRASWIEATVKSLIQKRTAYEKSLGPKDACAQTETPKPTVTKEAWEPDITALIEAFGQNTHTIADFYAHSNWVDSTTKKGEITVAVGAGPDAAQQKLVISGLGHNTAIDANVWDEKAAPDLITGSADGCASFWCVAFKMATRSGQYYYNIEGGKTDANTHAFWAKDESTKAGYDVARQLAVMHTVKEIELLWAKSEGNQQLRDIFGMDYQQKVDGRVQFVNKESCWACPFSSGGGAKPPTPPPDITTLQAMP